MVLFKDVDSVQKKTVLAEQSGDRIAENPGPWCGSVAWGCITGNYQCIVREGQVLTHCQELQGRECGFSLGFLWSLAFTSSSVKCYPEPILMHF